MSVHNTWACKVALSFVMECELIYKDLEDYLQNRHQQGAHRCVQ